MVETSTYVDKVVLEQVGGRVFVISGPWHLLHGFQVSFMVKRLLDRALSERARHMALESRLRMCIRLIWSDVC